MDFMTWLRAQRDRVGGWTCIAIGAVMVISAWFSISGTTVVSAQLTYLASGGIGGLFFLGAGFGLLLAAALVVYHSRSMRYGIAQRLGQLCSRVSNTSGEGTDAGSGRSSTGWYVVKGSGRYHVAGCQALDTSLTTAHISSARHLGDLEPCRLCDAR